MTRRRKDLHVRHGDLKVFYEPHLDGGGRVFGADYVPFVRERIGRVGRAYEWCAGPGFIGFSLLASGLCESLCLADVNPEAIEMMEKTVRENALEEKVSIYLSDCFDNVPGSERWDLVIGNPPHSGKDLELHNWGTSLIYQDVDWDLHRRFYAGVASHMNEGARIILQENYFCSEPETFRGMIEDAGLRIRSVSPYPPPAQFIYYLWSESDRVDLGSEAHEIFSGRDYYFSDPNQRRAEEHFREDGGYARRPALTTAAAVIDYRRVMLVGDLWTRAQLTGRKLMLSLSGSDGGNWLIAGEGQEVRVDPVPFDRPPEDCDSVVAMAADLFVDIYDHRLSVLAVYAQGALKIDGDFRLAQAVLCGLLNPSGNRRPPGENGRQ